MSNGEKMTAQRPSMLDAFELRFDLADAGGDGLGVVGGLRIAERDVADVVAAVGGGEESVARRGCA